MAVRRRRRRNRKTISFLKPYRPFYDRLFELQGGVCGICGRLPSERRKFDMDHDHKALYLRGLLCPRCNRALPSWMTPAWLRAAADYLERGPIAWLEEEVRQSVRTRS